MVELYNGDCIDVLRKLKDESIDFVLTDPPYNISKSNNFSTMKSANRVGIDFGDWDKNADITSWIYETSRIVKKDGSMIIFSKWHNLGEICDICEEVGFEAKDIIRWVKRNPMPRNRDRRYISDYELALWVTKKGGKWSFNRRNENYQRPEFYFPVVGGNEKTVHPTQKPVALMGELLKIHTDKGMTVLDPFMGSGTTGVACKVLGRNFIGAEISKEYFDLAEKRINRIKSSEK